MVLLRNACLFMFHFVFLASGQILSPYDERARIFVHNGNVYVEAARNMNIRFGATGSGSIFLGSIPVTEFSTTGNLRKLRNRFRLLESRQNMTIDQITSLIHNNALIQATLQNFQTQTLERDECERGPCQNGALCIDGFNKFYCICPPEFTGKTCSEDVDECALYKNTDLGCQNGGTCLNTHGGFRCQCPSKWHGYRCTEASDQCKESGLNKLCGPHGTCVSVANPHAGMAAYKCFCEVGWKQSESLTDPYCVDVDECLENPCFPGVHCSNTPGGFKCGSCPVGYTGDGARCWDVDECAQNNGHCSTSPKVQCINTFGSYHCGACPPGYEGDGMSCSRISSCASNPCHTSASCIEMPCAFDKLKSTSRGYRCQCPLGFVGDGIGLRGCVASDINPCTSDPCQQGGTCQATSFSTFLCHCPPGYDGIYCESVTSCHSSPCKNGGTCAADRENGYRCICRQGTYGINCEKDDSGCGGHFSADSGTITFPAGSDTYSVSQTCTWFITGAEDKILNVTFPKFDIESPYGRLNQFCTFDNLTLLDGQSLSAPVIGVYCGIKGDRYAPEKYTLTSTNKVVAIFRSDPTVGATGFQLHWESTTSTCGERLYETSGEIRSPKYPTTYPAGIHCRWILKTQPGFHYKLQVTVLSFASESVNCTGDLLEIDDGARNDGQPIAQYCTSTNISQNVFYSSLPEVRVYFRSAGLATKRDAAKGRFLVTFAVQELDRRCGAVITDQEGEITSPNYGKGYYFSNLDCLWVFQSSMVIPTQLQLVFLDFDVQGSFISRGSWMPHAVFSRGGKVPLPDSRMHRLYGKLKPHCMGDYVEIRDERDEAASSSSFYCGDNKPSLILSSGPKLSLLFHTEAANKRRGFRLTYKRKCGLQIRDANGTIQSPNFPNSYSQAEQCEYTIRTMSSFAIEVLFMNVDLGNENAYFNRNCTENFIQLDTASTVWFNKRFCSMKGRIRFTTSGGYFKIIFNTNGTTKNKGFQAAYKVYDVGCGAILNNLHGVITSPSYPDRYLHNMDCVWKISVPSAYRIKISFNSFALEEERNCTHDYVAVYETYQSDQVNTGFLGRFCGHLMPSPLASTYNLMAIVFHSDSNMNNDGFELRYDAVKGHAACDFTFTASHGVVSSYGYPEPVFQRMSCTYHIRVNRGYKIRLHSFNLTLPCRYGYLEFRNGPSETSPIFPGLPESRLCDGVQIDDLQSHGNMIVVMFRSYGDVLARASLLFRFEYEELASSCGGVVSEITGDIASPQHPYKSSHSYDCTYHVVVPEGIRILYSTSKGQCSVFDTLQIFDGPYAASDLLENVCGELGPPRILTSSRNQMTIRYRHFATSSSGFLAKYTTVCKDIRLFGMHGSIKSPGFRSKVASERECNWEISTYLGNHIHLRFHYFNVGNSYQKEKCSRDYVKVGYEKVARKLETAVGKIITVGPKQNATLEEARFCNALRTPGVVIIENHSVVLKFVATAQSSAHFGLEWSMHGCGGVHQEEYGTLQVAAPSTSHFGAELACAWVIEAPVGKKIALQIHSLLISTTPLQRCTYTNGSMHQDVQALHIFNSRNNASGYPFKSICTHIGEGNTMIVESTSNQMFLLLLLPLVNLPVIKAQNIFSAEFTLKSGGCGGDLNELKGSLQTPGYPSVYDDNLECNWRIRVPHGFLVEVEVINLSIGNQYVICSAFANSVQGYLAVFDGPEGNSTYPILAKMCSDVSSARRRIISTENVLFVKFKGAKLKRKSVRGFSGLLLNYAAVCGSKLKATAIRQTVSSVDTVTRDQTVKFNLHYLSVSTSCSGNYMEIFDGSDPSNDTLLGRLCENGDSGVFFSTGNILLVRLEEEAHNLDIFRLHFSFSYSSSDSGWRQIFSPSTVPLVKIGCGGDYYSSTGRFTSPSYPEQYPSDMDCVWRIFNSPGNRIRIEFKHFKLADSYLCGEDFLEIREKNQSGSLLGRYCGAKPLWSVEGFDQLWIRFRSIGGNTEEGFELVYTLVMGGDLTGDKGLIASPFYYYQGSWDVNDYITYGRSMNGSLPSRQFIWWRITCEQGRIVAALYEGFCDYSDPNAPTNCRLLDTVTTWTKEKLHTASTEQMTVLFHLKYNGFPRFVLSWKCVNAEAMDDELSLHENVANNKCLYTVNATEDRQAIQSPNYPSPYPPSLNCFWFIAHPRNFSVTDNYINKGLRRAYKLLVFSCIACGSSFEVNDVEQVLTSPSFPLAYPNDANCSWTIFVKEGRTIQVVFSTFQLQDSINCTKDYLEIFNGDSMDAPSLGRFCGSSFTQSPIVSTSSEMIIQFVSDGSISATGFSLSVAEVQYACGNEQLRLHSRNMVGVLTSPDYPNPYRKNLDCIWIIESPSGTRVQLDFNSDEFDLESYSMDENSDMTCWSDYLEVRDGATQTSRLLGKYCGGKPPGTVKSSSNFIWIRFVSESSRDHKGFKATYRTARCGGIITTDRGFVTSPNYPQRYKAFENCEWTIQAHYNAYFNYSFALLNFGVKPGKNLTSCKDDETFVELRENNATGTLLGIYCRPSRYKIFGRSRTNRLYILFKSGAVATGAGFKLEFTRIKYECGRRMKLTSGQFESPNYPEFVSPYFLCTYVIEVPLGYRIILEFDDIDLPPKQNGGAYGEIRMNDEPICGSHQPRQLTFESTGNDMIVQLVSTRRSNTRGFRASYTSVRHNACGGLITRNTFVTLSPFQSYAIAKGVHCEWQVQNPTPSSSTTILHVAFLSAALPDSCYQNYVTLKECGGTLFNERGSISSPKYPEMYPANSQCHWLIVVPEGSHTEVFVLIINLLLMEIMAFFAYQIRFTDIDIENHQLCWYDNVTVHNGPFVSSPVVRTYCDSYKQPPETLLTSSSRYLLVVFQSDSSSSHRGFQLEYNRVAIGCGSVVHGLKGYILSPSFPRNYPPNQFCIWEVIVPAGYHVVLHFVTFDLQPSIDCSKDSLIIEETDEFVMSMSHQSWHSSKQLCGYDVKGDFVGKTDRVRLKFKSDKTISSTGFNISWSSECGGHYTNSHGIIKSPNYPDNYENDMNCEYVISPNRTGHFFTVVEFMDFHLESKAVGRGLTFFAWLRVQNLQEKYVLLEYGEKCHDYVELETLASERYLYYGCGDETPAMVTSFGGARLIFRSNSFITAKGFMAHYWTSSCGGKFFLNAETPSAEAAVSTDSFIKYINNMNCTWVFETESLRVVSFKFKALDIEEHPACSYDYVEILEGEGGNARRLGKFCGSDAPSRTIKSSGNKLILRFVTDSTQSGTGGFSGVATAVIGPALGCGGVMNISRDGMIKAPEIANYGKYGSHVDCDWTLMAPLDHVVSVDVLELSLRPPPFPNGLCDDYLEFHDGFYDSGALIGKYCGTVGPWSFKTSQNVLMLSLYANLPPGGNGFRLRYAIEKSICGGFIQASEEAKYLRYAQRPDVQRCMWVIARPPSGFRLVTKIVEINSQPAISDCKLFNVRIDEIPKRNRSKGIVECSFSGFTLYSQSSVAVTATAVEAPMTYFNFTLAYKIDNECNNTILIKPSDYGGQLTSPNYPNLYPHSLNCYVKLSAPTGYKISLFFKSFMLERSMKGQCEADYLTISESNGKKATYCGWSLPPTMRSATNELALHFATDAFVNYMGYKLTYMATPLGRIDAIVVVVHRQSVLIECGGIVSLDSGIITSPEYPIKYPANLRCEWRILMPSGSHVKIVLFEVELSEECSQESDRLIIYEHNTSEDNARYKFCGTQRELASFELSDNDVKVVFVSGGNGNKNYKGFRLYFERSYKT
ncbi:cubilin [Trichuris trichiura]|uniref:Cubilin n=1 Tax=Trichuris trichiura TaxID=36087 RepID=A0A077YZX4_TRITR|nr:cubilin [Trichuris trichiura]